MRYLSPDWVAAANRAVAPIAVDGLEAVVQHVVTGGPGGDCRYYIDVRGGRGAVVAGETDAPTLTFTEDYETAAAVARGDTSAQAAFMAGRIRIGGDLSKLGTAAEAMAALDSALGSIRDDTEYG